MGERRPRLGDVVDDYCPRCKLLMNHGVMALAGDAIVKVRCNTCMNEHPYRHGKGPKRKDPVKSAFDELISKMPKGAVPTPPARAARPPDEEDPDDRDEPES